MGHVVTAMAGDGVGPEIMLAMKRIVAAAGVDIVWEDCLAGAEAFRMGIESGVPLETLASMAKTKVAIKGPLTTPVGYGSRSANVTLRKAFETYGNIRSVKEIPGLSTPYTGRGIDLVVVRENVEDLYVGVEYYQTPTVAETTKIITALGCEKICRLAFELAKAEGRRTVHCATKANIMKFTEGMFKRVFEAVAHDYPTIKAHHLIVDNCAHQLVINPEQFDVIVTTNLNGDILSDLASGLVGGLGVAPSANLGDDMAIFESVHGSAPDIAGQDKANPTAISLAACMMLRHLGEFEAARQIEEALVYTLGRGQCITADLVRYKTSGDVRILGTQAFADEVIKNLGRATQDYSYGVYKPLTLQKIAPTPPSETLIPVGFDVFVALSEASPDGLRRLVEDIQHIHPGFVLESVACRGVQVWPTRPNIHPDTVDYFRCRFKSMAQHPEHQDNGPDRHRPEVLRRQALEVVAALPEEIRWVHIQLVQDRQSNKEDREPGYS